MPGHPGDWHSPRGHPSLDRGRTANVRYYLGVKLQSQVRPREAEHEVRAGHEELLAALGRDHPRTQAAHKMLDDLRTGP